MASVEMVPVKGDAPAKADGAVAPKHEDANVSSHHSVTFFKANYFSIFAIVFQVALIILYGTCTHFDASLGPQLTPDATAAGQMNIQYAMFTDTHTMMLIGFGFLYTLMRRYAWSGVSWNFLITAFVIQWAVLLNGFWERVADKASNDAAFTPIQLNIGSFIRGDYAAATVLISFGAVLGRVSPMQMVAVLFWEAICSTANEVIGAHKLHVSDPGGSMYIHTFGAAFGLALAYVLGDKAERGTPEQKASVSTSRHNGTFAMIGTLFLFIFWPSFNAGMYVGASQHRIVINTLLSICASVTASFAISKAIFHGKKFDMEHIQNATIAGGVAIGAVCNMLTNPWGALATGAVAGAACTYGFTYFTPKLKAWGLTDTCGVLNLHFMSGVIGGIASAIAAARIHIGTDDHDFTLASAEYDFPGRVHNGVEVRSALQQGGYQMAVVAISILLGVASGAIGGFIAKLSIFEPKNGSFYEDAGEWNTPADEDVELQEKIDAAVAAALAKHEKSASARQSPLQALAAKVAVEQDDVKIETA